MSDHNLILGTKAMLLVMVLASSVCVLAASDILSASAAQSAAPAAQAPASTSKPTTAAQSPATKPSGAAQSPAPAQRASAVGAPVRRTPKLSSRSANLYYGLIWGVDSLRVKYAESGEIIRFTYRVLDAEKAKALNDKKNEPSLIDPGAGVKLVVPSLEKVGKLRQSSTPQAGKVYWMAFSNKGGYVKPGHRVSVVIGTFRVDGLVVQ
jgi:hypothetical protein